MSFLVTARQKFDLTCRFSLFFFVCLFVCFFFYQQIAFKGTLDSAEVIFLGVDDISFSREKCNIIPNDGQKGMLQNER